MQKVKPIDKKLQRKVINVTNRYIRRAGRIMQRSFDTVPVRFDLTGRMAGMYRVDKRGRVIRFNPYIFAKYFEDNLAVTVPHEVAHYIIEQVHGLEDVRPHGEEWQSLMRAFGASTRRTCHYDFTGVPVRSQRRFAYRCACLIHQLSARRHNQIIQGTAEYYCRHCGESLRSTA